MAYQLQKLLPLSTTTHYLVVNSQGEDLGKVRQLMIDLQYGRIAYAVLDFGDFLGVENKFYAVPWDALSSHFKENRFHLNIPKEAFEKADGFSGNDMPNMADRDWGERLFTFYGYQPYWIN